MIAFLFIPVLFGEGFRAKFLWVMLFNCFTHGTKSIWIHSSPNIFNKKFVFKHNCFILFVLIEGLTEGEFRILNVLFGSRNSGR